MPEIKVTKQGGFRYGTGANRKQYGKGDTLIVKQKDARTLVAAKLAAYADDVTETQPKATAKAATAKAPAKKRGRPVGAVGTYNRRDMKAK